MIGLDHDVFKDQKSAAQKLKEILSRPIPKDHIESGQEGFFDPWDVFPGITGSYNSEIDRAFLAVLKSRNAKTHCDDVAKKEGLDALAIEIICHILTGSRLFEYGVSPRALFPTQHSAPMIDEWAAKWEAWCLSPINLGD